MWVDEQTGIPDLPNRFIQSTTTDKQDNILDAWEGSCVLSPFRKAYLALVHALLYDILH